MHNLKQIIMLLSAFLLPVLGASGMDRLDALSEIESHNNDHAIGKQLEVSRYQILPAFWEECELDHGGTLPCL